MQEEYSLVVQLTKAGHTVVKAVDAAGTTCGPLGRQGTSLR